MSIDSTSRPMQIVPAVPFSESEPDVSKLVTEDDTPVDGICSEKQMRLFQDPLNSSWKEINGGRPFVSLTNVGFFYEYKEPPLVQDGLLSLDVSLPDDDLMKKEHRSYFLWKYRKTPEYILEVVSNTEGEELGSKKTKYAMIGVRHYVVWDPARILDNEPLHVFRLRGKKYVNAKETWFADIGLGVTVWHGEYEGITQDWLRWCDEHGSVLPAAEEGRRAEKLRADKLAERLRAMGIEP